MTQRAIITSVAVAGFAVFLGAALLDPEITGVTPNPVTPSPSSQTLTVTGHEFMDRLTLAVTSPGGAVARYPNNAVTERREASFQAQVMLPEAGAYSLVVTNPDGRTSPPYRLDVKRIGDVPTITEIKPADLVKSTSPQTITVLGGRFVEGMSVTVTDPAGQVQTIGASGISQLQATSFNVLVTLEIDGEYAIVVTSPTGQVSNSMSFKVGRKDRGGR